MNNPRQPTRLKRQVPRVQSQPSNAGQQQTLTDLWLYRIRNNPIGAAICVLGTIVIACSTFWIALYNLIPDHLFKNQDDITEEQQILLNIMHAVYHEPLQLPATLKADAIHSPVSMNIINNYIQADYPKSLVLSLFVDQIQLRTEDGESIIFDNSPGPSYLKFEAILQAMIDLGLSTASEDIIEGIGPPFTATQFQQLQLLKAVSGQASSLQNYEFRGDLSTPRDPQITASQIADFARQHVTEYYRLVSTTQTTRFCFYSLRTASAGALAGANAILRNSGILKGSSIEDVILPDSEICDKAVATLSGVETNEESDGNGAQGVEIEVNSGNAYAPAERVEFVIKIRSFYDIMNYLAAWARAELPDSPDSPLPPPAIKTGHGDETLFAIRRSCPGSVPSVVVKHDGTSYCIEMDPTDADRSGEVMDIVSQLAIGG